MRFKIRPFNLLCLLSLSCLLLVTGLGCSGLTAEQQAAIQPITLNYWTVFGNVDQLKKLAADYKKIRPYVTVNIRQLRYEEFDTVFTNALAEDVGPDIISVQTRNLRKYQNRLSSMPVSVKVAHEEIQTSGYQSQTVVTFETNVLPTLDAIKKNYISTVADDITIGGTIYGLPLTADTMALYYNKDLLDKAGIALPPSTWDQFSEDVKKTTKYDKKGNIVQAGAAIGTGPTVDHAFDILSLLMMQNGLPMATGNQVTFADGVDRAGETHPAVEALRFYTDFARPTKDIYTWNDTLGKAIDAFAAGKVVFFLGFGFDYGQILARAPQLNISVSSIPQLNTNSPVDIANYWVETVVKKSAHQNEAWDFIRFLSAPSNIKTYSKAVGEPSPLRADIADQSADPVLGPFANQLLRAHDWYHGRDIDAASRAMIDLITGYLAPIDPSTDPARRDAALFSNAQAVIQQTF